MYDLHRLGWNSFQQLCLTIAREVLGQTVQSFLDSNDAGRDGAFAGSWTAAQGQQISGKFVIQCKFSSRPGHNLAKSDIADELPKVRKLVAAELCDVFSPDLLGIFLSGSSTENLLAQVTCGNVGVEKAVVVSKTLFPTMIGRLREFSGSSKYKVGPD